MRSGDQRIQQHLHDMAYHDRQISELERKAGGVDDDVPPKVKRYLRWIVGLSVGFCLFVSMMCAVT